MSRWVNWITGRAAYFRHRISF